MPRMPLYPSLPSSLEVVASMVNAPEAIAWIFISNGSFRPHASQGRALVPAANLAVVCLLRAVLYLVRRCKDWPVPISCPLETKFNPVAKTCAKRKSFKLQYLLPTCIQLIKGLIAAQDIGFGWAVNGTFANKPCRLLISEAMRERKKIKKSKKQKGGKQRQDHHSLRILHRLGRRITLLSGRSAIFRPELFQKHSRHETKRWDAGETCGRR